MVDNWNYNLPWYHGSQQELTILRVGSSVTQDRDIARIFSHRPGISTVEDDGTHKHNGTTLGYLHIVDEPITAADVEPYPHPINASKWEWLTKRVIKVRLIEQPALRAAELLTEEDLAVLRARQQSVGQETFRE
ncbi:MAG TPA: hypothetical protein P5121_29055 [Caldilineaceae bacterium]|nr:hypothetical protein [Caldilineaceae bacterium]